MVTHIRHVVNIFVYQTLETMKVIQKFTVTIHCNGMRNLKKKNQCVRKRLLALARNRQIAFDHIRMHAGLRKCLAGPGSFEPPSKPSIAGTTDDITHI